MSSTNIDNAGNQRLIELLMAISLATDIGTGQPMGHALRTSYISAALARELRCEPSEIGDVLHVALLRFLGCTSDAAETAAMTGGNDVAFNSGMELALMGPGHKMLPALIGSVGVGHSAAARAGMIARMLVFSGGPGPSLAQHCEVASMLAGRLGLSATVTTALAHGYERWDGKGHPTGLRGEAVPLPVRVAVVARDADLYARLGEDVLSCLLQRSGHAYDPEVVEAFSRVGLEAISECDATGAWEIVLGCEPQPQAIVERGAMDRVLGVFAAFVDLKSPWTRGHSPEVARLADAAAQQAGMDLDTRRDLRHAALVRDIGRVGIENGIWDKPGPLTTEEWERVRLHPYLTQRILERCSGLASLAAVASADHERLDGSGYHRGTSATHLSQAARVLAAADVFAALCAARPHRPALSADEAAAVLENEAREGRLDADAVGAVLGAAGQPRATERQEWPAGLTDREIEVLQLIARGNTNRETAAQLDISPKTVGRHIENIYNKAGVSTRAGAAVFAMEHRLLT